MEKKLTRTQAVKMIFKIMVNDLYFGGLPRAIDIYNYISGFGTIDVTERSIWRYFNTNSI